MPPLARAHTSVTQDKEVQDHRCTSGGCRRRCEGHRNEQMVSIWIPSDRGNSFSGCQREALRCAAPDVPGPPGSGQCSDVGIPWDRITPITDPTSSGQAFFASRPTGNSFPGASGSNHCVHPHITKGREKAPPPLSALQHHSPPGSCPSCPITVPSHVLCPQHHGAAGRAAWGLCTPILCYFHSPFQPKCPQPLLPHKDSL